MGANVFDLAAALVQAAPQVVPELIEKLDKYLTPEQKRSLLAMHQSQTQTFSRRSNFLSSSSFQRPALQPQFKQNLMDTVRYVPEQQFKHAVLSIANERHKQAKEMHALILFFFIICMVTCIIGVVLMFTNLVTGGTLTLIFGFFSTIGGMLTKAHSENNQRLNELVQNIQST